MEENKAFLAIRRHNMQMIHGVSDVINKIETYGINNVNVLARLKELLERVESADPIEVMNGKEDKREL